VNSNLTGGPNPGNPPSRARPLPRPVNTRTPLPRNNQLSSSSSTPSPSSSFNLRAHYNLLSSPNGRSPPQSGNGVALASYFSSKDSPPNSDSLTQCSPGVSPHLPLLNDIYALLHHISSYLPPLFESPAGIVPNFTGQASPYNTPSTSSFFYSPSHFPPPLQFPHFPPLNYEDSPP